MPFEHADSTVNKTADKVQSGGIESAIKDAYTGKKNGDLDFRPSNNPGDSVNKVLPKLTIDNGCSDSDNVAPSSKNGKYFPNKGESSSDLGGRHGSENSKNKSEGDQDSQWETKDDQSNGKKSIDYGKNGIANGDQSSSSGTEEFDLDRQQINESAKSAAAEERKSMGDLNQRPSESARVHPKYDSEGQIQDMQPGSSRAQVMGEGMLDKRNNHLDRN